MGPTLLGLVSGNGINVAITGMQLVVLFMLMATLIRVQDIWKWHKPIPTKDGTGEFFPWKIDPEVIAQIGALVGAVGQMAERDEKQSERVALLVGVIEEQNEAVRRFDDKLNRLYWSTNHPEAPQPKEAP